MPFEENDKRIREAANQHHPAYDEKAWDKMEKLLDEHLPVEKKDKRRIVFWLFLFMLAGGGAAYMLFKPDGNKNEIANVITVKEKTVVTPATENEAIQKEKIIIPSIPANGKANENLTATKPYPSVDKKITEPLIFLSTKPSQKNKATQFNNGHSDPAEKSIADILEKNTTILEKIKAENEASKKSAQDISDNNVLTLSPSAKKEGDSKNILPEKNTDNTAAIKIEQTKEQQTVADVQYKNDTDELTPKPDAKTATARKQKNKKGNGLFFGLSAGPEFGKVGSDNSGTVKPVFGIGIGYAINKRISIQTGFYAVRKIYTAAGEDYNAPEWWQQYYPNLEEVNADCEVYEIPLVVSYNFIAGKKSNLFGSLGLSSYLMKKESYVYHYKTNAGQYRVSNRVFNNDNKHLFSIVNLGLGYERRLTPAFSFTVSPYVKLPLSGVGFGKVKLNSSGIMIGAIVKPFTR
jgi:hypothetical protein